MVTDKRELMMSNKYSKKFNYAKKLVTVRTSGADEWRSLEIEPDDMESIKFHISDCGNVIVEFLAYGFDANMTIEYKDVHLPLSELKDIIAEVEQIASVTFEGESEEEAD